MCGIAGVVGSPDTELQGLIDRMTDSLEHRGPDDRGTAVFPAAQVALGMRRLSILDIEGGHQPMVDASGRYHIVFNGEIYNFADLRRELVARGHRFRTSHSDTEVILNGFAEWGSDLFHRLNGMFAVAIWDDSERRLSLARDRTGKKPLYIAETPQGWAFGSELKALLEHPGVAREIDLVALEQYLSFDYVLGPRTMLRSVRKLGGGQIATIGADGGLATTVYWRPEIDPQVRRLDERELLERFDALLDASVRRRMVADVPVGLFLSGGLDSTTVGHFMGRNSGDVHSFSIGFEDDRFDESAFAEVAAKALGTRHHLEVFSQDRLRELVPRIADVLDEPMGDQSILPTYLLSLFTRRHVKVALGGDGSDELLMGYNAYRPLKVAWTLDRLPKPARRAVAETARRSPVTVGSHHLRGVRFARRADHTPLERLLSHLGSFKGSARWVMAPETHQALPPTVFDSSELAPLNGAVRTLTAADRTVVGYVKGYLQEDILVKVDRASMASSLEVRAPFLDPELMSFAMSLPPSMRLRGFTGKYLLRRLMAERIPRTLIERPKVGFGVPLNGWLRESLAPMVRDYLAPSRLQAAGYFDPSAVGSLVEEHLSGASDRGNELWLLLQFELWRERWLR